MTSQLKIGIVFEIENFIGFSTMSYCRLRRFLYFLADFIFFVDCSQYCFLGFYLEEFSVQF